MVSIKKKSFKEETWFKGLVASFPDVIRKIKKREFDSHDFIGGLIKENPRDYIDTLYFGCRDMKHPVRTLHATLAKELTKDCKHLVRKQDRKQSSTNIHSKSSAVEKWHKILTR